MRCSLGMSARLSNVWVGETRKWGVPCEISKIDWVRPALSAEEQRPQYTLFFSDMGA